MPRLKGVGATATTTYVNTSKDSGRPSWHPKSLVLSGRAGLGRSKRSARRKGARRHRAAGFAAVRRGGANG